MRYRAFWMNSNGNPEVIDQRLLPHKRQILELKNSEEVEAAIRNMTVRGAGTIGSLAAIGVYLAVRESSGNIDAVERKAKMIRDARPTAVNLMWAVDRMLSRIRTKELDAGIALEEAIQISREDVERTSKIGQYGYSLMQKIMAEKRDNVINVLTHCNAGWLGIADSGSALAPVYEAHRNGMNVHVWVDETRPRNQGALTSWELTQEGISHTVVVDNAGGLLMMQGKVDIAFVGADRVAANGDTANKIGTYLKALAAKEHNVPFYVCLPESTFDFATPDGSGIEIEDRSGSEVLEVSGIRSNGDTDSVRIYPEGTSVKNPAFDITPAKFITGLISERGICNADTDEISKLFSDITANS